MKTVAENYLDEKWFSYLDKIDIEINKLPYKVNISKPLTEFKYANFGENQSVEVYPLINIIDRIVNYDRNEQLLFNYTTLKNNTVTIQKPST